MEEEEEEEEEGPSDRPSVAMGERVGGRREAPSSSSFCPCIGMEGAPPVPSRAAEEATENSGGGRGKKNSWEEEETRRRSSFSFVFLMMLPFASICPRPIGDVTFGGT